MKQYNLLKSMHLHWNKHDKKLNESVFDKILESNKSNLLKNFERLVQSNLHLIYSFFFFFYKATFAKYYF